MTTVATAPAPAPAPPPPPVRCGEQNEARRQRRRSGGAGSSPEREDAHELEHEFAASSEVIWPGPSYGGENLHDVGADEGVAGQRAQRA